MELSEISEETRKPLSLVEGWVSGDEQPHGGDLKVIAQVVGRSPLFFSLKSPPVRALPPASFRKPIGRDAQERPLSNVEQKFLRLAERQQKIAVWAAEKQGEDLLELPPLHPSADQSAQAARSWLQWSPDEQVRASSKAGVFSALRNRVESRGVMVSLQDMGTESCRGFSLPSPSIPMIVVNKSFKLGSVRSYTLLHELAHLIRGEEAVCDSPDDRTERWCDKFAAVFLMPEGHLRAYSDKWLKKSWFDADDIDSVRRISKRYKASYHAVAIRLKELGMAGQDLVDAVQQGQLEIPEGGGGGGEPQTTSVIRLRQYGAVFTRLITTSVEHGDINPLDGQKYLDVAQSEFLELSSRVRRVE